MSLTALVRRAHTIGAHIKRIPVPVRFEGRTWRTCTRWITLDTAETVLHVGYSTLPHQPTWMVAAYWGHGQRQERHLVNPTLDELCALLDAITSTPPAELVVRPEPLGQLSLFELARY